MKERRFNVIDRAQQRAKADIMAVEDEVVFTLLNAAAEDVNPVTTSTGSLTRQALKDAFKEVEKHDRMFSKFKTSKH